MMNARDIIKTLKNFTHIMNKNKTKEEQQNVQHNAHIRPHLALSKVVLMTKCDLKDSAKNGLKDHSWTVQKVVYD